MRYDNGQKSPDKVKALILKSLDADKAVDIETLDLRSQNAFADYIVVASGTSSRHIAALAEKLSDRLGAIGMKDVRIEGLKNSDWVVLDAGDIVVHLFKPEVRAFYSIEKMWQTTHPSIELLNA